MAQTSRKSGLSPGVPLLKELLGESLKDVAMCWKSVLVAAWHLGPAFALRATTSAQAICVSRINSLLTHTSPANTNKVTWWCLPKAQRGRAVLPGWCSNPTSGSLPPGPSLPPASAGAPSSSLEDSPLPQPPALPAPRCWTLGSSISFCGNPPLTPRGPRTHHQCFYSVPGTSGIKLTSL